MLQSTSTYSAMMVLQRSRCLLFAGWLSVSANSFDGRRSASQRVRIARCPRLELDHHAGLSHEGESHSLDAHFAQHEFLETRSGASAPAALLVGGAAVPGTALPVAHIALPAPEPVFEDELLPPLTARPITRPPLQVRGRAPPQPSC